MRELSRLGDLSRPKASGPAPSFKDYHLLWALETIESEGSIGRGRLSRSLNLGEGAGRTVVERLRDTGLIEVSRAGCSLTDRGREFLREIRRLLSKPISLREDLLGLGGYNTAILVRGVSHLVDSGIEERDASVRAGALGAVTLLFKEGTLSIPGLSEDAQKEFPLIADELLKNLDPKEGDVILVVAADTPHIAEKAVRATALYLLSDDSP